MENSDKHGKYVSHKKYSKDQNFSDMIFNQNNNKEYIVTRERMVKALKNYYKIEKNI